MTTKYAKIHCSSIYRDGSLREYRIAFVRTDECILTERYRYMRSASCLERIATAEAANTPTLENRKCVGMIVRRDRPQY